MSNTVTGGIAIVFDSEPQFRDMLEDSMPRDQFGNILDGAIGMFVDASGLVISASGGGFSAGDRVDLPRSLLSPPKGQSVACVHKHHDVYYATGARLGQGYREFKSIQDTYQYEVTSIVMIPLGSAAVCGNESPLGGSLENRYIPETGKGQHHESQFATFYAGGYWLAIPTEIVEEAIMVSTITQIPGARAGLAGVCVRDDATIPIVDLEMMGGARQADADLKLIVVVSSKEGKKIGMLADQLGAVIGAEGFQGTDELGWSASDSFATGVLKTGNAKEAPMAVVIDPVQLFIYAGGDDFSEKFQEEMAFLTDEE
jgi:chemotaxis signal transduction protein